MFIYKAKENSVYVGDLNRWLEQHLIHLNDRFSISWKVKKRRKLRTYRILKKVFLEDLDNWVGDVHELTLKKGEKTIRLDNYMGPCSFDINSL